MRERTVGFRTSSDHIESILRTLVDCSIPVSYIAHNKNSFQ